MATALKEVQTDSGANILTILEEKDAIGDLLSEYCFHVDNGDYEDWINLFTADGAFVAGPMGTNKGHEALTTFAAKALPAKGEGNGMKHCTMNSMIKVNGDEASAESYIVLVAGSPESDGGTTTPLAGRYRDKLRKVNGQWRFAEREVLFDILGELKLK